MIEDRAISRKATVNWLLEESEPSVRYFTLRDILGKNEDDPQVMEAKRRIAWSTVIQKTLEKQKSEGYWEKPFDPYIPKYKSSYWVIMVLGQLGMDRTDERVARACEYIFRFQLDDGGFSSFSPERAMEEHGYLLKKGEKLASKDEFASSLVFEHQYSCLTGNMAAALIRLGYEDDRRVRKALRWLVKVQNRDGGWLCPYWHAHIRDKHGCFYGSICPLEAFSEVKDQDLTSKMRETVRKGAEFLLMHRLYKADHHGLRVINKSWLTLGFPWFYGYNILRGLDVLTKLGYVNDERLNDAADVLLQKRGNDGTWVLESAPAGRMQANLENKGEPSKWITLIALRVLKRLGKD